MSSPDVENVEKLERDHLKVVIQRLNESINHNKEKLKKLSRDISVARSNVTRDLDSIPEIHYLNTQKNNIEQEIRDLDKISSSPYFGRIDLDSSLIDSEHPDGTTETHYIGEKGFMDGTDTVIIDWRTEIGGLYYRRNETSFRINDIELFLALRRSFVVNNGHMDSCVTDYKAGDVKLEGEIIDPFLQKVLQDKRRNHYLTNIIQTIQKNQNDIIRKPINENFVVQGCAGSGKTMILLHRLSYLLFQEKKLPLERIKIITPSSYFKLFVNDLSEKLELSRIEQLTVDEFYRSLLGQYNRDYATPTGSKADSLLSSDMIHEIYSLVFQDEITLKYHKYWDNALSQISELSSIIPYTKNNDKSDLLNVSHTEYGFSSLLALFGDIASKIKEIRNSEELQKQLQSHRKNLNESQRKLTDYETLLEIHSSELDGTIAFVTSDLEKQLTEIGNQLTEQHTDQSSLDPNQELISKINESFESWSYSSISELMTTDNEAIAALRPSFPESFMELMHNASECEAIIADKIDHSAAQRNYYRGELRRIRQEIDKELSVLLKDHLKTIRQETPNSKAQFISLKTLKAIKEQIESIQDKIRNLSNLRQEVTEKNYRDPVFYMESERISSISPEIASLCRKVYDTQNFCTSVREDVAKAKDGIEQVTAKISENTTEANITENDLNTARLIAENLKKASLHHNIIISSINELYLKHNISVATESYRHGLYLELLFDSLYHNRTIDTVSLLCIDEAQDLSLSEYRVLRKVLGKGCSINLYGDIQQSLDKDIGISNWSDLQPIIPLHEYSLNENYRNTVQITDYCNTVFGNSATPIGINGEEVLVTDFKSAIYEIITFKKSNPSDRIAILYKNGAEEVRDELEKTFPNSNISINSLIGSDISFVPVNAVKGLEFEAVCVIEWKMSNNERYVAYTRALDKLIVVKDDFNPVQDIMVENVNKDTDIVEVVPTEGVDNAKGLDSLLKHELQKECEKNPNGTTIAYLVGQIPGLNAKKARRILGSANWAYSKLGHWYYKKVR